MADDPTPNWQLLTALPLIASIIDGELADGQEHHAALLAVRDRPHVLDDATVERSIKLAVSAHPPEKVKLAEMEV